MLNTFICKIGRCSWMYQDYDLLIFNAVHFGTVLHRVIANATAVFRVDF
jgi:hypothetical protein